ncbi:MAG: MFS transporter [Gammaproteobacteria bacterium SG8_15]|nr:MAG: MFS transporter [Gammaproteobacteria bacterium SG8_15]
MEKQQPLPKTIWALGFVSLFMDVSSEIIHSLLPLFMVSVLGASLTMIGLIEGLGEGLALVVRVLSGSLSDKLGRRKLLIVAGYLMGTLSKPLFALAQGAGLVAAARSLDRIGKGLRGAPRDALVADVTPEAQRGAAYGLRQSLDSVGAFVGPILAIVLMSLLANDFRLVFWVAVIPGAIALIVLIGFVKEPATPATRSDTGHLIASDIPALGSAYWILVSIGIVFTLARFSEAFILIRAQETGLAAHWVPGMLAILSLFYALGAYPAGRFSDRIGRTSLLNAGLLFLLLAHLTLALATHFIHVAMGAALWGLHMAFTQGIFAALIADVSAQRRRGTAFGLFGLASGIAVLLASVIAGLLWDNFGPAVTFYAGALFTLLTFIGFAIMRLRNIFFEDRRNK